MTMAPGGFQRTNARATDRVLNELNANYLDCSARWPDGACAEVGGDDRREETRDPGQERFRLSNRL